MLIFSILKFLLSIVSAITNWIGSFGVPSFNFTWVDDLIDSIDIVFYIFPLYGLEPILILVIFFSIIRVVIAVAKFLFDAIPLI